MIVVMQDTFRYIYIVLVTCYNMKKATLVIRMYWRDYVKIKKGFPAKRGESMASYFERLADDLENKNGK